jgi:hypothetical protein
VRRSTVKAQAAIGFSKVIVRAHLNGTVAGILNDQSASSSAKVKGMLAFINEEFTRCHGLKIKQWVDER